MALGIYPRTEEHNRHISEAKKRYYSNPENVAKHKESRKHIIRKAGISEECIKVKGVLYYLFSCVDCGKLHYSQKIKGLPRNPHCLSCAAKIRSIGRIQSPETRTKIATSLVGHPVSEKVRQNKFSPQALANRILAVKGKPPWNKGLKASPEAIENNRQARLREWSNPEFRAKALEKLRHGCHKRPTKPEKIIGDILQELFPGEYKYVGGGWEVTIGRCVPDFINVNGQKKVLEVFGDYWHSEEVTGLTREQEERQKIDNYQKYGFACLIIWQYEALNEVDLVREKIKAFHKKATK
jgi:hypothetical protein